MNITDILNNRSSKKINEAIETVFGKKLDLEAFTIEQLEDSRNRLRTQLYTVRTSSGFNETVENDSYTKAQWMLDAINAEVMQRESQASVQEGSMKDMMHKDAERMSREQFTARYGDEYGEFWDNIMGDLDEANGDLQEAGNFTKQELLDVLKTFDENMNERGGYGDPDYNKIMAALDNRDIESAIDEVWNSYSDQNGGEIDMDDAIADLENEFKYLVHSNPQGRFNPLKHINNPTQGEKDAAPDVNRGSYADRAAMLKSAQADGRLKDNINNGEDMTQVRESATDKASAVVTAKTMVDRVGRWIEELAGMENDTLLSLGDTIRDEMGQDQAKAFLSNVAPAIQQALQNLKATRETLATGVRGLTGEEQSAELIGSETPDSPELGGGPEDEIAPVAPDEMNTGEDMPADEFAASEPAVGGMETAGRAQRESIDRSSQLLRVLAG